MTIIENGCVCGGDYYTTTEQCDNLECDSKRKDIPPKNKMNDKERIEELEIRLCEFLDKEVYLPVKEELKGVGRTYSLGIRKENFKAFMSEELKRLWSL